MHKRFRSSVFSRSSFRPAGVLILILSLLLSACASGPEKSDSAGTLPDGLFAGQTTSAGTLAPRPTTAPTMAPTEAPTTAPTTTAPTTGAPVHYAWQTDPTSVTDLDEPLEGFDYSPYLPVPDDVSRTDSPLDYLYSHNGINHVGGGEKYLALSFTVGTEMGYTARLLDVLKEKDVPVVFLISLDEYLMSHRDDPAELVRRMVQEGHIIGSHGYTHIHSTMATNRRFINELLLYQARIDQVLRYHYPVRFFGAPYETLIERDIYLCDLMDIHFLGYSRLIADENGQSPVYMVLPQMKDSLIPGSIIQMHISDGNTDAISEFIDYAREQGYRFVLPGN